MKKAYLNYSLEELIEDRPFIAFVVNGEHQQEWETFLAENPSFALTVNKARKIIDILEDQHEPISEEAKLTIWKNIEQFDLQIKNRSRQIKTYRLMRYAAILLIGLLLGGSVTYWMIQHPESYVFSVHHQGPGAPSRLLLTDGTEVILEKKNSQISMNAEKQIIIDNDEVIELSDPGKQDDTKMNEVVVPFGRKAHLFLEDGTMVWLNAGSKLAFPTKFTGNNREVFLEGEAYFDVAPNKKLPFYVNTQNIRVNVLGTKFNISAYPSDAQVETFLLEGKLSIRERSNLGFLKDETLLAPNQKGSYHKEQKTLVVSNEQDIEFAIAWTEGWFKFSQENINDVLNKIQRYYNVQFVFEHQGTTPDLITGKLDLKDSIEKVMLALSDVAKIRYQIVGDKIHIQKK